MGEENLARVRAATQRQGDRIDERGRYLSEPTRDKAQHILDRSREAGALQDAAG